MPQRAIRLSETTDKAIREATEKRGFASPSAFVRHAVEQELSGRKEELASAEERLVVSIDQVRGELLAVGRAQQALFALVDSLAKILLTCIPEPDREALESAVARAHGRHTRLLKNAGQAMGGDSRLAMQELVKHGER
jgi:Arc/MetJ-type ribon-helix-helix transcriptional regulator